MIYANKEHQMGGVASDFVSIPLHHIFSEMSLNSQLSTPRFLPASQGHTKILGDFIKHFSMVEFTATLIPPGTHDTPKFSITTSVSLVSSKYYCTWSNNAKQLAYKNTQEVSDDRRLSMLQKAQANKRFQLSDLTKYHLTLHIAYIIHAHPGWSLTDAIKNKHIFENYISKSQDLSKYSPLHISQQEYTQLAQLITHEAFQQHIQRHAKRKYYKQEILQTPDKEGALMEHILVVDVHKYLFGIISRFKPANNDDKTKLVVDKWNDMQKYIEMLDKHNEYAKTSNTLLAMLVELDIKNFNHERKNFGIAPDIKNRQAQIAQLLLRSQNPQEIQELIGTQKAAIKQALHEIGSTYAQDDDETTCLQTPKLHQTPSEMRQCARHMLKQYFEEIDPSSLQQNPTLQQANEIVLKLQSTQQAFIRIDDLPDISLERVAELVELDLPQRNPLEELDEFVAQIARVAGSKAINDLADCQENRDTLIKMLTDNQFAKTWCLHAIQPEHLTQGGLLQKAAFTFILIKKLKSTISTFITNTEIVDNSQLANAQRAFQELIKLDPESAQQIIAAVTEQFTPILFSPTSTEAERKLAKQKTCLIDLPITPSTDPDKRTPVYGMDFVL